MQANQTRAAVLYGPGDLRVETRDVPPPGAGEVVLQVAVSGICGTDLHYWDGWQFDSWFPGAIRSMDSRARVHRRGAGGRPRRA